MFSNVFKVVKLRSSVQLGAYFYALRQVQLQKCDLFAILEVYACRDIIFFQRFFAYCTCKETSVYLLNLNIGEKEPHKFVSSGEADCANYECDCIC